MAYIKTTGFLLHRLPALASGNTPVVFLTEDFGKLRVLVKGLQNPKSKMAARLDPLVMLEMQLYQLGDDAFMLTQAHMVQRFADITMPLARIEALWQQLGALMALLPEAEPQPDVLALHQAFLERLSAIKQSGVLADMVLLKTLMILGHAFVHERCMSCERDIRQDEEVLLRVEDMLLVGRECEAKLSTAVGLMLIPHLVYKTLALYQTKSLQLADMVKVPEEIAKQVHETIMLRLQTVIGT